MRKVYVFLTLFGGFVGCGSATDVEPPDEADMLPLLAPGQFLSTTSYGSAPEPDDASTRGYVSQAAGAGMNGFAFGCTSSTDQGSSAELQGTCFEAYFDVLTARQSQVRFASVFTLTDLDEITCDAVVEALGLGGEGLPPEFVPRVRGFLCEVGLRAADGASKPAWDAFIEATGSL